MKSKILDRALISMMDQSPVCNLLAHTLLIDYGFALRLAIVVKESDSRLESPMCNLLAQLY